MDVQVSRRGAATRFRRRAPRRGLASRKSRPGTAPGSPGLGWAVLGCGFPRVTPAAAASRPARLLELPPVAPAHPPLLNPSRAGSSHGSQREASRDARVIASPAPKARRPGSTQLGEPGAPTSPVFNYRAGGVSYRAGTATPRRQPDSNQVQGQGTAPRGPLPEGAGALQGRKRPLSPPEGQDRRQPLGTLSLQERVSGRGKGETRPAVPVTVKISCSPQRPTPSLSNFPPRYAGRRPPVARAFVYNASRVQRRWASTRGQRRAAGSRADLPGGPAGVCEERLCGCGGDVRGERAPDTECRPRALRPARRRGSRDGYVTRAAAFLTGTHGTARAAAPTLAKYVPARPFRHFLGPAVTGC
ncbi:translation initiation factor IF-2-like [Schistocerca cancellata]|uniref:translation initiation factor IF-2-like n=1 Tax=Schistocerca cancellata TaxID=274614 RepID=UPI002118D235|nr:translation initiation factor IF-2-like [Schistocerca cancellata]